MDKKYLEYSLDLKNIRLNSSSGGAFYHLARIVLDNNGVVFGVVYDSKMKKAIYSNTEKTTLSEMMKSKYIAAELGDSLKEVQKILRTGRQVLFSGTPCTIAGVRNFIDMSLPEYKNNIILVDFFCEGVPSPAVFKEYINTQENKFKSESKAVYFRSKEYGWQPHCMKIVFANEKQYVKSVFDDPYMSGFIELLFNRECCYDCKYRRIKKSDITLGDFWRASEVAPQFENENIGISSVIANTELGNTWIQKQEGVYLQELSEEECKYAEQYVETKDLRQKRDAFILMWETEGFINAIKCYGKIYQETGVISLCKRIRRAYRLSKRKKIMEKIVNDN